MEELRQNLLQARQRLNEKDQELVAAHQRQQQMEEALRHVLPERQALHGEVRLLQHVRSDLEAVAAEERRRRQDAERRCAEAELRTGEAERRAQDAEQRCREAERAAGEAERRRQELETRRREAEESSMQGRRCADDAELRLQQAEQRHAEAEALAEHNAARALGAERSAVEASQRLQDAEREWKLRSEARAGDLELKCAETDLRRQQEVRAAMLELQSLAQSQQTMSAGHIGAGRRYVPTLGHAVPALTASRASRQRPGPQQPWEALGKASTWARSAVPACPQPAVLLTGRTREQVELLDQQVRELEARKGALSAQPLPGFV